MPPFDDILYGATQALSAQNLLYVLVGVALGTLVGLLPGVGAPTGIVILLPVTLSLEPVTALIMLAGVYYGSQYGGSITAILIATPGESSQVMTALEGYKLARRGRAGPALAISALSSFAGGIITLPLLIFLLPALSSLAIEFGPPEYAALLLFGIVGVVSVSAGEARSKGVAMAALGVVLSTVGLDPVSGIARFTLGTTELMNGILFVPAMIGVFAIGEALAQLSGREPEPIRLRLRDMFPTRQELRFSAWPAVRGSVLGFFVGVLPGAGGTIASYFAYDLEKRVGKRRHLLGRGAVEGIAGPEAANNSATNGAFVPTLTLGVPGSSTTAVLLGALLVFGLRPGPQFMTEQADLAWTLVASFAIGNVALLVLNLPMAPMFASALRVRYAFVFAIVVVASLVGAYATQNDIFGVWLAVAFGAVGLAIRRFGYPPAPLILGLLLGGMLEQSLVQTSIMSSGDLTVFLTRPLALSILSLTVVLASAGPLARWWRARQRHEEPLKHG